MLLSCVAPVTPGMEGGQMAITAAAALRRLCELKHWSITNLEAQKLLYFGQMIALGRSNEPLVEERFQAWDLGPVLPAAYHKAKIFGNKPIKSYIFQSRGPIARWESVFKETLDEFGDLTGAQLVAETHWDDGAWAEYYRPGAKGVEIPNDAIRKEFHARTVAS